MSALGADLDLGGAFFFALQVTGMDIVAFKEVDGLSSETEVVEHKSQTALGKPQVTKSPGQISWSNITLKRGVDQSNAMYEWRKQVEQGQIQTARKDGTVVIHDSQGTPKATYSFVRGWPCKYSTSGLTADGNEILIEEIEIAHEGLTRV